MLELLLPCQVKDGLIYITTITWHVEINSDDIVKCFLTMICMFLVFASPVVFNEQFS